MFQFVMSILIFVTIIIFSLIFMNDASNTFNKIMEKIEPPKKDKDFVEENYNDYYEDEFKKAKKQLKIYSILNVVLFEAVDVVCKNLISRYFFVAIPIALILTLPMIIMANNMEKKLVEYTNKNEKIIKKFLILPLIILLTFLIIISIIF